MQVAFKERKLSAINASSAQGLASGALQEEVACRGVEQWPVARRYLGQGEEENQKPIDGQL